MAKQTLNHSAFFQKGLKFWKIKAINLMQFISPACVCTQPSVLIAKTSHLVQQGCQICLLSCTNPADEFLATSDVCESFGHSNFDVFRIIPKLAQLAQHKILKVSEFITMHSLNEVFSSGFHSHIDRRFIYHTCKQRFVRR